MSSTCMLSASPEQKRACRSRSGLPTLTLANYPIAVPTAVGGLDCWRKMPPGVSGDMRVCHSEMHSANHGRSTGPRGPVSQIGRVKFTVPLQCWLVVGCGS